MAGVYLCFEGNKARNYRKKIRCERIGNLKVKFEVLNKLFGNFMENK